MRAVEASPFGYDRQEAGLWRKRKVFVACIKAAETLFLYVNECFERDGRESERLCTLPKTAELHVRLAAG